MSNVLAHPSARMQRINNNNYNYIIIKLAYKPISQLSNWQKSHMTNHCQLLSNSQRQKTITCYQLKKQTNQSVKPITIKPCIAKPHNKRLRAKSSVEKTPETFAILLQITVANRHFGTNFANLTAFLHKKYSPVTSCVTKSVTSCHRAVTLCHAMSRFGHAPCHT